MPTTRTMKKIFLITYSLFIALCVAAADTLTLDLSAILDNYPQTEDGYWEDTYTEGTYIEDSLFRFAHSGSAEGMAYWEGFTLCTSGDTLNWGEAGSSDGWITHQWGCMAGGGSDTDGNAVEGAPYLVAYWGFYREQMDDTYHSLRIDFTDGEPHRCLGTYIANHPWPYYGNINGDGFADGFSNEGDFFALDAHGLNEQGEPTGVSVRLVLAEFTGGELHQSKDWQWFDLSPLGLVSGIYFTMTTSDSDELYGANTAVYFCLDGLRVLTNDTIQPLSRPSGLEVLAVGEDSVRLAWNPVVNAESYLLFLDNILVELTADTAYTFVDLQPYHTYSLAVQAVRQGDASDKAVITAMTTDETAPTMPGGLQAEPDVYSITLTWQAAEDNVAVRRYTVYLDGDAYKRQTDTVCTFVGLTPDTGYLLEVEAEDEAGNKSDRASLYVSTVGETALETILPDEDERQVYTLDGRPVGNHVPIQKGTYIIQTTTTTYIVIH